MHPATVKTEGYQDPSLGLDTDLCAKTGPKMSA